MKTNMKIVLFDECYDTKSLSALGMENQMQKRLDAWLGTGTVVVKVSLQEDVKKCVVTLWREYGDWYSDPKVFRSSCNDSIFTYDETIFLGRGYQTGTVMDLKTLNSRYIWSNDIKTIFLPSLKEMAKKYHGTRIKSIEVDNNLDHIELTLQYL